MSNRAMIVAAFVCASVLGGCVGDEPGEDDLQWRAAPADGPWWVLDPSRPGDGHVGLQEGGRDDPDGILWDLDGGSVSRSTATSGLEPVLTVDANELRLGSDVASGLTGPRCTVELGDHPSGEVFHLVDAQGDVVFTAWERFVFAGEPTLSGTPHQSAEDASGSLVMSFVGPRVHAGAWWSGPVLAEADRPIATAGPVRRLLMAALLSNECGVGGA